MSVNADNSVKLRAQLKNHLSGKVPKQSIEVIADMSLYYVEEAKKSMGRVLDSCANIQIKIAVASLGNSILLSECENLRNELRNFALEDSEAVTRFEVEL